MYRTCENVRESKSNHDSLLADVNVRTTHQKLGGYLHLSLTGQAGLEIPRREIVASGVNAAVVFCFLSLLLHHMFRSDALLSM